MRQWVRNTVLGACANSRKIFCSRNTILGTHIHEFQKIFAVQWMLLLIMYTCSHRVSCLIAIHVIPHRLVWKMCFFAGRCIRNVLCSQNTQQWRHKCLMRAPFMKRYHSRQLLMYVFLRYILVCDCKVSVQTWIYLLCIVPIHRYITSYICQHAIQ